MSLGLRRLLASEQWSTSVSVLAGSRALDRPVRTVRAAVTVDLRRPLHEGELVVLMPPLSLDDWRVDVLLRRIADATGAGLVLPGLEPLRSTRRLADLLEVPLLGTTGAPLDLCVSARMFMAVPELDGARLLLDTHRALGKRAYPPDVVVAKFGDIVHAPVALLDDKGERLAGGLSVTGPKPDVLPVPSRTPHERGLVLVHPVPHTEANRVSEWLAVDLPPISACRADAVARALDVAAGAIQRWLLSHRLDLERDARSRGTLLGDLLRLNKDPGSDLRRRAADAGWALAGWHVGLRLNTGPEVDTIARRPDITRVLEASGISPVVVEYGNGWAAWTTYDNEPTTDQVDLLARRVRDAHRTLRRTVGADMGVGRPHADWGGLATTLGEASDAARLATARPEVGHFLRADQLGMAQLLLEWARTDTFEPAARKLLAPLGELPGDLVGTLSAYLDSGGSLAETAAVLGVHRNTVASRVERVERTLDVTLKDRDDRLALHLACRTVALAGDRRPRPGSRPPVPPRFGTGRAD